MPTHLHGHSLRNPCSNHVSHCCLPKVVGDVTSDSRRTASPMPLLVIVRNWLAGIVEDKPNYLSSLALRQLSSCPAKAQYLFNLAGHIDNSAIFILCGSRLQSDGAGLKVNIPPCQLQHFVPNSPAAEIGKLHWIFQVPNKVRTDRFELRPFEEALPDVILLQQWNVWLVDYPALLQREVEHALQGGKFSVDRSICQVVLLTARNIIKNLLWQYRLSTTSLEVR